MKTNNFFMLHLYLVRKGKLKEANWLLRRVIHNRQSILTVGLYDDCAWSVMQYCKSNGYFIRLTY